MKTCKGRAFTVFCRSPKTPPGAVKNPHLPSNPCSRVICSQADPENDNLAPIRSTRGVLQMLRFGLKLAILPDKIIEILKSSCDPETGLSKLTYNQPAPGDKVRVLEGPLAGLSGIFKEKNKQARAILLLDIIGKQTKVEVDSLLLERA